MVEWQTRQLEVLVLLKGREGSTPFGDTVSECSKGLQLQTGARKSVRVRLPSEGKARKGNTLRGGMADTPVPKGLKSLQHLVADILGRRLTAGRLILVQSIEVRILAPQQSSSTHTGEQDDRRAQAAVAHFLHERR